MDNLENKLYVAMILSYVIPNVGVYKLDDLIYTTSMSTTSMLDRDRALLILRDVLFEIMNETYGLTYEDRDRDGSFYMREIMKWVKAKKRGNDEIVEMLKSVEDRVGCMLLAEYGHENDPCDMLLEDAVEGSHRYFVEKGFWVDYPNYCNGETKDLFVGDHAMDATYFIGTKLALINSEVTECLVELNSTEQAVGVTVKKLKEEIADIALRAFDLGAGLYGKNEFSKAIANKIAKGESNDRPYKHGKRF